MEERYIDLFCKKYNAVVFCDNTSNYKGEFRLIGALLNIKKCCFGIEYTVAYPFR